MSLYFAGSRDLSNEYENMNDLLEKRQKIVR